MSNTFTYRSGPKDVERVPVGSGTVIEIGDLLKLASNKATPITTSTDNLTFCGVAAEAHRAVDPSGSLAVYPPNGVTVFEYDLDAATDIGNGDQLQWNAAQAVKKSTTDAIATAVRSELQATTVQCKFQIPSNGSVQGMVGDAS
jgi:hypothetical protein